MKNTDSPFSSPEEFYRAVDLAAEMQRRIADEALKLWVCRRELERQWRNERDFPELYPPVRQVPMEPEEAALHICAAEGHVRREQFVDAWRTLQFLPLPYRTCPEAQRVRLLIFTLLRQWDDGEALLDCFTEASPSDQREAAGRFLLAHAVACFSHNSSSKDAGPVKEMARRAVRIWAEGRAEISRHPVLSRLW